MPIVAATLGLAALVWGVIVARRGSIAFGCALLLPISYALGHQFWHAKVGPLPLTLDRLVLVGLVGTFAWQWRAGQLKLRPLTTGDWVLGAFVGLLACSALLSGQPDIVGIDSKWGRLLANFVIPTTLFLIVRQIRVELRDWSRLLTVVVVLGVYLAITAVLETLGAWGLVFPRYIADPTLGIHFGRARGPDLNSVSLGLYLTAAIWCAWTLLPQVQRRWQQLALVSAMPLMALGVFLTYTRSTWIGLALSGVVVAAIQIPRKWRLPALGAGAIAGMLVLLVSWSAITGLKREGSAEDSSHSVDQRTSFAYVSWKMFRDHPVLGVGFGRFYDRKLPYLSDRSQPFELESIRGLNHHNTLLSLLTETGMVGLATFAGVLAVWVRCGWRLVARSDLPAWMKAQGVLMLAIVVNYLSSAAFHDLTLIPSQQVLLFLFAGLTVNLGQQAAWATVERETRGQGDKGIGMAAVQSNAESAWNGGSIKLFGMSISRVTMQQTIERVLDWCAEPRGQACRSIVTPNVDHAVMFQHRGDLRAAYADASLVLADGTPIVLASRLLGRPLPERVAGSDLVPQLFEAAARPHPGPLPEGEGVQNKLRVFLLGAAPGVADAAAMRIREQWPKVEVVGTYSPPLGFERDAAENERILSKITAAQVDLLIVGFGAPKQELWLHEHQQRLQAKVAICAGATIDFLAGHRNRSPVWMRRVGLEWLHRVSREPRRLASRYARDAWEFPQLVWREWRLGA